MEDKILSVKNITKRFGGLTALKDVSFDVKQGEIVGLMGPNGAGKTTLLNVIAGEYRPDAGTIHFKGKDITGCKPHQVCRLGMGRTYQIPQPFVALTVRENLLVASTFGRKAGAEKEEGVDCEGLCDLVGLSEKPDMTAGDLQILSLKKLELARALAAKPDLLLLDEVAAGSTDVEIPRVSAAIKKIRDMGITVVIIEHVLKVLVSVVDRIVVIDKGMKIAEGAPGAVMNDCKVVEAYFGA